jgi:hypothetical protein
MERPPLGRTAGRARIDTFAPPSLNPTSLAALAFGSFAVASAILLILEVNQPFSGLFRVPSVPIERAIAVLGKSPS